MQPLFKKQIIFFMICLMINQETFAENVKNTEDTQNEINSATITASTLKAFPHCVHYAIKGVCYWYTPPSYINTTDYVEHYLPDVVVSVFNKPGENPWTEMNTTIDQAGGVAQNKIISTLSGFDAGSGQHSVSDVYEQNTFFKEAEIIGNPALSMINSNNELLPSTASSLTPYYQSMLDSALWRGFPQIPTAVAEETFALGADILHHVGIDLINWGGIYPHEGKVVTSNDAKAAAVIAQRAGDLITSTGIENITGHVFMPLSNVCGQECMASPVQENSDKTLFQMIYPVVDDSCDYFGKTISYGEDAETKTNGAYMWVIWRFYSGCIQGEGKYIGKIISSASSTSSAFSG